ncbi:hypothetical protein R0K05_24845, partial [Planococcus sp. SIMBA_160]
MHKDVKAIYDESKILDEATHLYGVQRSDIHFIADAENYVYEMKKDGESFILKITHTIRRSPDYILGEME